MTIMQMIEKRNKAIEAARAFAAAHKNENNTLNDADKRKYRISPERSAVCSVRTLWSRSLTSR